MSGMCPTDASLRDSKRAAGTGMVARVMTMLVGPVLFEGERHWAATTPAKAATAIEIANERFMWLRGITAEGRDERVVGTLLTTGVSGIAVSAAAIIAGGTRGVGISEGC